MLIITVLGYVLSLGPSVLHPLLRSFGVFKGPLFEVMLLVDWIVQFASHTSYLGNLLIYAYYNRDFRKEISRIFCRRKDENEH